MRLLGRGVYYLSLQAGIVFFTFVLFHLIPSDPARVALGANAEEAQVAALRAELGLDRSTAMQFAAYVSRLVRLDLGRSFVDWRPVWPEVTGKLAVSLTLLAICIIFVVTYVCGVTVLERATGRAIGAYLDFLWVSTPTMFSAVLVALLGVRLWPFSRFSSTLISGDNLLYLVPPALVLALYPMATMSRLAAREIESVSASAYIRTARALGVPERRVLGKYILRNAAVPLLAGLASQVPFLLTGAFVVETVFSVPGIGSLLVRSLLQRDLPMIEGIVLLNGFFVLAVYLAVEAAYPLLDPRIRVADAP